MPLLPVCQPTDPLVSWMSPVAKNAVKYGVKYGPQAKVVWNLAGKQVQSAAKAQADNVVARRMAFAEAETLVDGSVIKRVWEGHPVWVVLSGDRPLAAYPPPVASTDLTLLVADADLSKRITPEQHRQAQLRARAKRAGKKAGRVSRQAAEAGRSAARVTKRRALGSAESKSGSQSESQSESTSESQSESESG